jgi:hypothetical protein
MFMSKSSVGHILAPWPFLIFGIVIVANCAVACPAVGAGRGEMMAFDVAAIAFLLSCAPLFRHGPQEMRRLAEMNDARCGLPVHQSCGKDCSREGKTQSLQICLICNL